MDIGQQRQWMCHLEQETRQQEAKQSSNPHLSVPDQNNAGLRSLPSQPSFGVSGERRPVTATTASLDSGNRNNGTSFTSSGVGRSFHAGPKPAANIQQQVPAPHASIGNQPFFNHQIPLITFTKSNSQRESLDDRRHGHTHHAPRGRSRLSPLLRQASPALTEVPRHSHQQATSIRYSYAVSEPANLSALRDEIRRQRDASEIRRNQQAILTLWYRNRYLTTRRELPMRLSTQDREALLQITNTSDSPKFLAAWFRQKTDEMIGVTPGLLTGFQTPYPTIASLQCETPISQQDLAAVVAYLKKCQHGKCTTKDPENNKPYCCHHCGAGFINLQQWVRHREQRFVTRLLQCLVCRDIGGRHVVSHLKNKHNIPKGKAKGQWREIFFNAPWSDSCRVCTKAFTGPRVDAWRRLQTHIFDEHIKRAVGPSQRGGFEIHSDHDSDDDEEHVGLIAQQGFDEAVVGMTGVAPG